IFPAEAASRGDGPHVEHADVAADGRSPNAVSAVTVDERCRATLRKGAHQMRMKLSVVLLVAASAVTSLSAHVMVSPLQSKTGAVQKYELRIHNEAKVAATSIDLDIPDG